MMKINSMVKYENEVYVVEWMDENKDNLYIYNAALDIGHSSVSKHDVQLINQ